MILVSYNIQYATAIVNDFFYNFAKFFYTENFIPIIDFHSDKILLPTIPTHYANVIVNVYQTPIQSNILIPYINYILIIK